VTAHAMTLTETFPDDRERWECPKCGRIIILSYPPTYQRIVIKKGDDPTETHTCSKGIQADIQIEEDNDPYLDYFTVSRFTHREPCFLGPMVEVERIRFDETVEIEMMPALYAMDDIMYNPGNGVIYSSAHINWLGNPDQFGQSA